MLVAKISPHRAWFNPTLGCGCQLSLSSSATSLAVKNTFATRRGGQGRAQGRGGKGKEGRGQGGEGRGGEGRERILRTSTMWQQQKVQQLEVQRATPVQRGPHHWSALCELYFQSVMKCASLCCHHDITMHLLQNIPEYIHPEEAPS